MEYKGWGNIEKEKKVDMEKRKFIKNSALVMLGVIASMRGLDEAINFFSQDNEKENKKPLNNTSDNKKDEISIKEPKTEKPDNVSEAMELNKNLEEDKEENRQERILNAEEMAEEILRVYSSSAIARRFDNKVFSKDFFMAQQFQESRGDHTAESSSGARGVYQNKPESVIDVIKYLAFLREETKDLPEGKRCDYTGPMNISEEEAKKISSLFLKKADYGRATGKLYLLLIHDKDSGYNTGRNPDVFRSESIERQQKLLLLAYHDGPTRRRYPQNASPDAKKYLQLVRRHMSIIVDIRDRLEKAEMSRELDYAIFKILQKLDDGENEGRMNEAVSFWLKKLQEAHISKWRQDGNFGKPLDNSEIRKLFARK